MEQDCTSPLSSRHHIRKSCMNLQTFTLPFFEKLSHAPVNLKACLRAVTRSLNSGLPQTPQEFQKIMTIDSLGSYSVTHTHTYVHVYVYIRTCLCVYTCIEL